MVETPERSYMLGAIIGDMAGSIYEFDNIKSRDFEFLSERCEPTDDSILTCAIARALIDVKGRGTQLERVTMFRMKEYFLANPLPMGGFGAKFFQWALSDVTEPYGSWGNGAAMRISPVAYVANTEAEVKLLSRIVTGTTHNDLEGLKGGAVTALAVFKALHGVTKEDIQKMVKSYYPGEYSVEELHRTYTFEPSCQKTVPEGMQCFFESEDYESAIRNVMYIGGDCDTLGAIVGAVAGAYYGIPEWIQEKALSMMPDYMVEDYEDFKTMYMDKEKTL
jgi:ADP-ribosylglycohydrolase